MKVIPVLNNLKTHVWANILAIFGFISLIDYLFMQCILATASSSPDSTGAGMAVLAFWVLPELFLLIPIILAAIIAYAIETKHKHTITSPIITQNKVYAVCFWLGFVFYFVQTFLFVWACLPLLQL